MPQNHDLLIELPIGHANMIGGWGKEKRGEKILKINFGRIFFQK